MKRLLGRTSFAWSAIGMFAVVGGFALASRALALAPVADDVRGFIAAGAGAAIAGAVIAQHAEVRPWREVLLAGLAAFSALTILRLLTPFDAPLWLSPQLESDWLRSAILGADITIAAAMGAAAVRKLGRAETPLWTSTLVLSGLVGTGMCALAWRAWALVLPQNSAVLGLMVLVVLFFAGLLVQSQLAIPRPYSCGSGMVIVMLLVTIARHAIDLAHLQGTIFGLLLSGAIGYYGARIGWRLRVRSGAVAPATIPSATAGDRR